MLVPETSLRQSLTIQGRVLGALLMREIITRFGRHNIGFLWLFLEPMLFTVGVTILWSVSKITHGSSMPITAFAVTGYSSILLWRNCSSRVVKAVEVNLSLLYHRNVRVFDVLTVIEGWLLLASFALAISLVVGAASERSELVERVWHIITYLLFPLSGAGFMVDWLPKAAQDMILWVPMVHGTEMIRHGYFGNAVHTYEDPAYLALCNLILTLLGLALVRDVESRVEPE